MAYVYILRCRDDSYYVGLTRETLELRVAQHNDGTFGGYTASRRPVELAFAEEFERVEDAINAERRLKKWTRKKKEALIEGDYEKLRMLSKRRQGFE